MLLIVFVLLIAAIYIILGLTATLITSAFGLGVFVGGVCVLAAMKAKIQEMQAAPK